MATGAEEAQRSEQLHVLFFPFLAHGHMIPLFDIVRLFAARGVKATVITTHGNAQVFDKELKNHDADIQLELIKFPSEEVGLPAGVENFEDVQGFDVMNKFIDGIKLLRGQLEQLLPQLSPRPSCIVADLFLPWTTEVAAQFGIPRLVFHGSGYIAVSVLEALRSHKPYKAVQSDDEEFVVPGVPGDIRLTRSRLSPGLMMEDGRSPLLRMAEGAFEAELNSFGTIMNSFHELELEYEDYSENVRGVHSWSIGPVSLYNRSIEDKTKRGKKPAINEEECKRWLDSKPPDSVVYISFGSIHKMHTAQLREIAMALDSLDQPFIWVVRKPVDAAGEEDWLPNGFETRNQGKGLIIRGWAPQVMILEHEATGVFVTHCGWNSTLEGISAGVSLVTWPAFAEQFINEKLITDVLKVGVPTGANQYITLSMNDNAMLGVEKIEAAIRRVTVAEEAEEIRSRAKELKERAWNAIKEGGSSYQNLSVLLEKLRNSQPHDEI